MTPATVLAVSEAEYQDMICDYARWKGWTYTHFEAAKMRSGQWGTPLKGDKGYPDLTLVRDGWLIFAEIKAEKGRVTDNQASWLTLLERVQGNIVVAVWRPSDWTTVRAILDNPERQGDTDGE